MRPASRRGHSRSTADGLSMARRSGRVARESSLGLRPCATDSVAKKHDGITTMAIDMRCPGVEVRPLRQITGDSPFNEVFFTDVFVADDDVVARSIAGLDGRLAPPRQRRVSIGGGTGGRHRCHGRSCRSHGCASRAGPGGQGRGSRLLATSQTLRLMNMRRAERGSPAASQDRRGTSPSWFSPSMATRWPRSLCAWLDRGDVSRRRGGHGRLAHPWLRNDEHRRRHFGDHPQPDRRAHPRLPRDPLIQ